MASPSAIMAGMAFVKITADNAELISGLKSSQGKLEAFSSSVKALGREMATMAAAVGPTMLMSLKTFSGFDDQMRTTKAVTGATGKEFEKLTELAGKLGDETSFTGEQVAAGMASLGRMGFSPKEIEGAIKPVMDLSRATGTELADAAEIAANNMRVFGMEAGQMNEAADLMAATANGSAQTLTDLGEALKMAGPHAKRAGADLKETCAALGILANMGIKGSLAGTALGKSYKRLADPKVIDYLKGFGIQTVDNNGNLRRMRDILVDLSKVMATMGSAEQITFAEKVFDARGSLGGGTLSVNTEEIDKFVAKLDAASGYADKAAKEMDAGIGGTLRRLSSAAEGFSRAFGKMIGEAFGPILDFCTNLILVGRDVINMFPLLTKGFILVAGVASALGVAMFGIGMAGKLIAGTVGNIRNLAAALTGTAAAQAQAETMKQLAAEKSSSARIAIENHRHLNEMRNAAAEAAAIRKKEAESLKAARERYNQEKLLNDKRKADYISGHGSAKGFKNNPGYKDAAKELKAQQAAATAAQEKYAAAQIAASQASATYQETKKAALAAAQAQAQYAASTVTAWGETKRLVEIEQAKRAALAKSVAAQKAAMNIGPLAQEQANHYALLTASVQKSFIAAEQAATQAALKICSSLGLTGTAADIAAVKILTMNNIAAGQAGWNALTTGLARAKAAVIAFCTAADKWQFTTLKNVNLTKLWQTVTIALGNAFSAQAAKMNLAAAGTAALGVATKGVTAAFLAAKAAVLALWAVMKAHPIAALITVIAALSAAILALCVNIQKYQESLMMDHADKYREKMDKVIKADETRMTRLQQLSQKQKLNNDEMKEAESLLSSMQKYGDDLGITLDKQTGQLNANAGAWENLTKAMTNRKISNIDRVIKQEEENIAELRGELKRFSEGTFLKNKDGSFAKNMSKDDQEARIDAIGRELEMRLEKIAALREEQRLLQNPPKTEENIEKEIQYQEELAREVEKAQQAQLAAEEKLARLNRTELENKIHDIEKEREEYKKNIQLQLDFQKGQKNQDAEKIKELEQKLAEADKVYQVQIDKAKKEQADNFAKDLQAMRDDYQKAQTELERTRKERSEDKKIDEAAKESPSQAIDMIDTMLLDLAKQIAESKKKVEAALAEAAKPDKDGKVSKDAQDKVKKSRDELAQQQSRQDSLTRKKEQLETRKEEQGKQDAENYGNKIQNAELAEQKRNQERKLDDDIQAALKKDLQSGIAMIKNLINQFAAAAESAKNAYEAAYAEAMKDGTINEDEARNLDQLFKRYSELSGKKQQYQDSLRDVQKNSPQQVKTLASFDAAAFSQMFGKKPARDENAERTAKATEDSEKHLKELLTKIGQLGWTGIS